ncbi:N-alkane-inducible cytochrome P450 [Aspergillus flavus]|nr:N-alkane-inducible cytochrome P450 [Aspergillus flavus]
MADTEKPDVSDNKPHHHLNTDVEHSSGENQSAKEANDPNVVDFDGPTTQRTPINWSTANKTVAIAIVSMMTMLS